MANPGFYVTHHYFLDLVDGAEQCHKVGHTKDLTKRLTHRAYKTCLMALLNTFWSLKPLMPTLQDALKTFFLKNIRTAAVCGRMGANAKMTFQAIFESVKIILSKHFPNLKVDANPDYFEDERYESDDED